METPSFLLKTRLGPTLLLAGTAIGSGMLSLPIVLAKFGITYSIIFVGLFAILTYFSALVRSDLNLNTDAAATLMEVGQAFHCPRSGYLGDFLLKLLSFALMSAYLSGGASMLNASWGSILSPTAAIGVFSLLIFLCFLCASKIIVRVNTLLFVGMFTLLILLILGLFIHTPIGNFPWGSNGITSTDITLMIPIIFTSFGFQGSIHSMTKLCQKDRIMIHRACLWGSCIPALVYLVWIIGVLSIISNTHPDFFRQMQAGSPMDVGELMHVLSQAAASEHIILGMEIVSIFAMLTSIFGVGLAMIDLFQRELKIAHGQALLVTVFTPALVAVLVPNAFIKILGISGSILAVIALIVPTFISFHMQKHPQRQAPFVRSRWLLLILFMSGIGIVYLGILG